MVYTVVVAKNIPSEISLGKKIRKVLVNYLFTQLILMAIVTLVVWGFLYFLNIKYSLLLAVLSGVLSAVPNYGVISSSIVVALVAIFDNVVFIPNMPSFVEGVVVVLVFLIFNMLIDTFLAPLILGKGNKLNPLLVFVSVILGTLFLGIIGAILAVPTLLIIKTVLEHYFINNTSKH